MAKTKNDTLKKAMVAALESTLGIVSQACKTAGVSRGCHYRWLQEDENYRQQVEDVKEMAHDFVESRLFKQIKEDNTTATIFFLKTQCRHRGYVEKTHIELAKELNLPEWMND